MSKWRCGYCGEKARRAYRPASDAVSFLCSGCVQWLGREPVSLKVLAWNEHMDLGEEREARWLEHFIPEEVLRGAKIRRLHHGGQFASVVGDKESAVNWVEVGETVSARQGIGDGAGVLRAGRSGLVVSKPKGIKPGGSGPKRQPLR